MYGNCLIFAIFDFIKNGGSFCIEFWPNYRLPHFSIQRKNKRYDFEIINMILDEIWYFGKCRITDPITLDNCNLKRYRLLNFNYD